MFRELLSERNGCVSETDVIGTSPEYGALRVEEANIVD